MGGKNFDRELAEVETARRLSAVESERWRRDAAAAQEVALVEWTERLKWFCRKSAERGRRRVQLEVEWIEERGTLFHGTQLDRRREVVPGVTGWLVCVRDDSSDPGPDRWFLVQESRIYAVERGAPESRTVRAAGPIPRCRRGSGKPEVWPERFDILNHRHLVERAMTETLADPAR